MLDAEVVDANSSSSAIKLSRRPSSACTASFASISLLLPFSLGCGVGFAVGVVILLCWLGKEGFSTSEFV